MSWRRQRALLPSREARSALSLALVSCLALALLTDSAAVRAGCAVPEPALWSPASEAEAPLDARVVVSLGGYAGLLRDVELRPVGGGPIAVQRRELPGPIGHRVIELDPEGPLKPGTSYELVARRPESWHPNEWVFGAFTTGGEAGAVPPALSVTGARYREEAVAGQPRRWIELELSPRAGADRATLIAVWLPDEQGQLTLDGAPSVYLPRAGDTLRVSSPELCGGLHVPLPAAALESAIAVAALDPLGRQSRPTRVPINFGQPQRRGAE